MYKSNTVAQDNTSKSSQQTTPAIGKLVMLSLLLGASALQNSPVQEVELCNSYKEFAKSMVINGASPNIFRWACETNRPALVRELISFGARPDVFDVRTASESGRADVLNELLKSFAQGHDELPELIETDTHSCSTDVCRLDMREKQRIINFYTFMDGESTLLEAAKRGHLDVVKNLIHHGADITLTDYNGANLMHKAAYSGSVDLLKFLVDKGFPMDKPDNNGVTPLMIASQRGHLPFVQEILRLNNNPFFARKRLDEGCGWGISSCGSEKADNSGVTATMYAIDSGNIRLVQELYNFFRKGRPSSEIFESKDMQGNNLAHRASEKGYLEILGYLTQEGGKQLAIDTKNRNGQDPLLVAIENGHEAIAIALLNLEVDINGGKSEPWNPRRVASERGLTSLISELCASALLSLREIGQSAQLTPLLAASKRGLTDVVSELIKRGANVTVSDMLRRDPLYLASSNGHAAVVEKLLACKEINLNSTTYFGFNAYDAASLFGRKEVLKLLKEHGAQKQLHIFTSPIGLIIITNAVALGVVGIWFCVIKKGTAKPVVK